MRTLRVADLEAKPGEKVSGYVHVIGAEFGIPVTLICGEKEGGTVLISGGVHNAEYVGIQAAMQLADELELLSAEATIRGMDQNDFIELCRKAFQGMEVAFS